MIILFLFSQRLNTLSHGQYSQVHKMRTLCGVFRATSLEILKGLSVGGNTGNTHFVRCIRSTLDYKPRAFQVSSINLSKIQAFQQVFISSERYGSSTASSIGYFRYSDCTSERLPAKNLFPRVSTQVNLKYIIY